jgi:hypothetical protein
MAFKCDTKEYKIIPLSLLLFDEKVADMVEANKKEFPDYLLNNIVCQDTFKLNQGRLDSILDGYNTSLPAISVVRISGKFSVENGRHRVCATIMNGGTEIPCEIVENA